MRRKLSLWVLVSFTLTLLGVNHGCSRDTQPEANLDDTPSFDINSPKIKERLGADDGYAFAVFYGADIHGSLETCG